MGQPKQRKDAKREKKVAMKRKFIPLTPLGRQNRKEFYDRCYYQINQLLRTEQEGR